VCRRCVVNRARRGEETIVGVESQVENACRADWSAAGEVAGRRERGSCGVVRLELMRKEEVEVGKRTVDLCDSHVFTASRSPVSLRIFSYYNYPSISRWERSSAIKKRWHSRVRR
jgi:hypothetical protein